MAPKRKSDVLEVGPETLNDAASSTKQQAQLTVEITKKARVSNASEPSSSSSTKGMGTEKFSKPLTWKDVELPGEDEVGNVSVYDDCAEVRRKIRLLQKTPGWKVTHWLKEIGGINSNSFGRFMKEKGRRDGASNGTYLAAYIYFEKVRILEGKKKSSTRQENETLHPDGFPLENRRKEWVFVGR